MQILPLDSYRIIWYDTSSLVPSLWCVFEIAFNVNGSSLDGFEEKTSSFARRVDHHSLTLNKNITF